VLNAARLEGVSRIAILGVSDLAEIAAICAVDSGIAIVAVVDPRSKLARFAGVPVKPGFEDVEADAVLVADVPDGELTLTAAASRFGADRVLYPKLLGLGNMGRSAA
jgi:hypothetical protein